MCNFATKLNQYWLQINNGVNEQIAVDEYAKSIGFYYQMFENLENL